MQATKNGALHEGSLVVMEQVKRANKDDREGWVWSGWDTNNYLVKQINQ